MSRTTMTAFPARVFVAGPQSIDVLQPLEYLRQCNQLRTLHDEADRYGAEEIEFAASLVLHAVLIGKPTFDTKIAEFNRQSQQKPIGPDRVWNAIMRAADVEAKAGPKQFPPVGLERANNHKIKARRVQEYGLVSPDDLIRIDECVVTLDVGAGRPEKFLDAYRLYQADQQRLLGEGIPAVGKKSAQAVRSMLPMS